MATMIESLFGLTPEMYQERRQALADQQALEFAKLTPFQQANFAIGRGAYQLAGALGGEDPQLKMVSARNAIAQQINYNDPTSISLGVEALAQAGDTVGAMQLAEVARKLESEQALQFQRTAAGRASLAAAGRERQQATPEKIRLAQEFALQKGEPGSPEYTAEYNAQLTRLTTTERPEAMTPEMRNAAALAALKGAPGSPEYATEYNAQLTRLTTRPEGRGVSVGTDREAVSLELYNKTFSDLTPAERAAVNKRVESEQGARAAAGAPKFPGDKALADVPGFRASVQRTIDPQLKAITAADQALQAINDSLATGNFAAYRAAQVQFARAIAGSGDLSQKELRAAGADPSLLGGAADVLSTAFSGTPTADTQKKIRDTLTAIRTVASRQAKSEVDQQRKIALRSPGYTPAAVDEALFFPQLSTPATATAAAPQAPIYARNRTTGERIMSTDGGKTWAPAPR